MMIQIVFVKIKEKVLFIKYIYIYHFKREHMSVGDSNPMRSKNHNRLGKRETLKHYGLRVCVRACVRGSVRACVCVCVFVFVCG